MKNDSNSDLERRFHDGRVDLVEMRAGDKKSKHIVGYASVFDSRSQNLGGFVEMIMPGAFDSVLDNDVVALFNHDDNIVLARSNESVNTLSLSVDETGLKYDIDPPETRTAKDLLINIGRGEVSQSSFSFTVQRDGVEWVDEDDGVVVRQIHKIKRLYDVSPVTFPAYLDTDVAMRSLEKYKTEARNHGFKFEIDNCRRRLELINRSAGPVSGV